MVGPIQSTSVTYQTNAVSKDLKDAKPELVAKESGSGSTAKAASAAAGNSGFRPPPGGFSISV